MQSLLALIIMQIKQLVHRGIPHEIRGKVWKVMISAETTPDNDEYKQLKECQVPEELRIKIALDIDRTFPDLPFFRNQQG